MPHINNEPVKYESLSKTQRLAVFLIVIGPQASARLLEGFDDYELEQVCGEISNIRIIDDEMAAAVIEEFSKIIGESMNAILGGNQFAQRALEMARGDYKAASILGRISPVGNTPELIAEISEMEPRQIFNLVRDEQSQTIAFLVSHLNIDKATQVVEMLAPEMREDVIERIGSMDTTSLEMVAKVVTSLKQHISTKERYTLHHSGGLRQVADLLNNLDKDMSKTLLNKLEERNPGLGAAIRKKMFSFDDLQRLNASDLQRVTREVEMSDLVVAMKSAQAILQEAIFASVSKRAAETLKEEIEMMGPVRLKEVEAAQDRIIQTVRRLEEEEEITLDAEGDKV
ncbi:MAG: flagellar motor switch protein FliG [Opitutales bacterium]